MGTWLLWIAIAFGLLEVQNLRVSSSNVQEPAKTFVAVAKYLDARVRGFLVCKGMTDDEVSRILGSDQVIFLSPSIPKPHIVYCYYKYGVTVYYDCNAPGVLRVERVTTDFSPIKMIP